MDLKKASGKTGWKRVAVGVVLALFLAPVPVLGFTFTPGSTWNFTQLQAGGAPQATTSFLDDPNGNGGSLTIGLGFVPPSPGQLTPASSFITATRTLTTAKADEILQVSRSFTSLLQGAHVRVFIYIRQTSGANPSRFDILPVTDERAGQRFGRVVNQISVNASAPLPSGSYLLTVRIKYRKTRFGVWDNAAPGPGSAHVFQFTGV